MHGALRVGECAAFYVVYEERVVLFCAPGVAAGDEGEGRQLGFALVTNASVGRFRAALDDADVVGLCKSNPVDP